MPKFRRSLVSVARLGVWAFIKRMWKRMKRDRVRLWAGALAHSYLFAFFALFLLLVTLLPYLPIDRDRFMEHLRTELSEAMPTEAAETLAGSFDHVVQHRHGGILSVGIIVALWTAGRGMAATMSALNHCNGIEKDLPWYKHRPLATLLTLFLACLAFISLLMLPLGGIIRHRLTDDGIVSLYLAPVLKSIGTGVRWLITLALIYTGISVTYHFGPRERHRRFQFFTPGAVATLAGWVGAGWGMHYYVDHFGHYSRIYGAVGGILVLLVVFYMNAFVFLVGAELNDELDQVIAERGRGK